MPDRTLFYAPIQVTPGDIFEISGDEFNHIINVLRKTVDNSLEVVNGNGKLIGATITDVKNGVVNCRADTVQVLSTELPVQVTLGVGLIKNQRYEWMVEKLTELGVAAIQPLQTDRVVRSGFRKDRLVKKTIAAMKQSERAVLPRIFDPVELPEYLANPAKISRVYTTQNGEFPRLNMYYSQHTFNDITILVGPEGGWSDAELTLFDEHEVSPVSLGSRRLRTETAAVDAMSQMALLSETSHDQTEEKV